MSVNDPPTGIEYIVGDAAAKLQSLPAESVTLIHLDDAWARPKRGDAFGVEYDTHPFDRDDPRVVDGDLDPELTTAELLTACKRVLEPGGVLLVDVDDWLIGQVLPYIESEWIASGQNAGEAYVTGQVVEVAKSGDPDRSTPGQYFSTGGYTVLILMKQACPHRRPHSGGGFPRAVRAFRQRENFEWGTAKPLRPYQLWVEVCADPGDHVVVPCAGTAPTAVAAERVHGDTAKVTAIDIEDEARDAWRRRRAAELDRQFQPLPTPDSLEIGPEDELYGIGDREREQRGLGSFATDDEH